MKRKTTCIIIDNRQDDIKVLELLVSKIPELVLVRTFTDPFEGMDYLENNVVDLLFLDISMPLLKGTEMLRMLSNPPVTVLCTAYPEFQAEGFELDVADCLLKPFPFDRFLKAFFHAKTKIDMQSAASEVDVLEDYIFVKTDYKYYKMLQVCDINYVKAQDDNTLISLVDAQAEDGAGSDSEVLLKANEGISSLYSRLSKKRFFKTHRSYIVAIDRIDRIYTDGFVELTIPKGKRISISPPNMNSLFALLGGKP